MINRRQLFTAFAGIAIAALAVAQTGKKAPKKDDYDPAKLAPGEVACGRLGHPRSAPCSCMKHRVAEADRAREKCYGITDRDKRIACAAAAHPCAVQVRDQDAARADEFDGESTPMPAQCSRSCTKARCECCHS